MATSPARRRDPRRREADDPPAQHLLLVEPAALMKSQGRLCRILQSLNPQLPYAVLNSNSRSIPRFCRTAKAVLVATLAVSAGLVAFVGWRFFHLPLYLLAASAAVAAVAIGLPVYLAAASSLPVAMYKSRGTVLEAKFLPFATSLALLLQSGLQLSDALRYMYEKLLRELPEFRVELDYIKSNLDLGRPLDRILVEVAMITPSPSLRALFLSLSRAARMGLHAATIVQHAIRNYLSTYMMLAEKTATSLGFLFEIYISVGLIIPIMVGIMALLTAIYPITGISMDALIVASTFILIPVVSAFALVSADSIMSRLRL